MLGPMGLSDRFVAWLHQQPAKFSKSASSDEAQHSSRILDELLALSDRLDAVDERLADLRRRLPEHEPIPRRTQVLALTAIVVVSLVLAGFVITGGAAAFSNPQALSIDFGGVAVAVDADADATTNSFPFATPYHVGLAAGYDDLDSYTTYEVYLPSAWIGRRFIVVLRDKAIMKNVKGSTKLTVDPITECPDTGGTGSYRYKVEHRCQFLHGVVPSTSGTQTECIPEITGDDSTTSHVMIHITGDSSIVTHPATGHRLISVPGLVAGLFSPVAIRQIGGIDLDGLYGTSVQDGCKTVHITASEEVTSISHPPQLQSDAVVGWSAGDAVINTSIVERSRDAEKWGNVRLAFGGLLVALAVGFIPVVYDAARARRRALRRLKSAPTDDT